MAYLVHYGVQGRKWGVRNYQYEDGTLTPAGKERYSKEQYERDKRVYGKRGAKRIQRDIEKNGTNVSGARSREAERINDTRRAARTAGHIGKVAGGVATALVASTALDLLGEQVPLVGQLASNPTTKYMLEAGMVAAGSALGSYGGKSLTMLAGGGYSPNKYRYA